MSYDGGGGEPDETRLHPVRWIVRSFPSTLRGSTSSEVHRRGKKRDLFRCTLSAHGKDGCRRHTSQLECHGPQFHQSTKRPPFSARATSAGLFGAACPAPPPTDTIYSRSYGKTPGQVLVLTGTVAKPNPSSASLLDAAAVSTGAFRRRFPRHLAGTPNTRADQCLVSP